jgi:regulation of enolase protein 1 (concanavalin A-like superfamily)
MSYLLMKRPFGDCSHQFQNGLEIGAANGRDMWHVNWSAPRLLRRISGDLNVQTVCMPAKDDRPAIGGLLLWEDENNYLRVDCGVLGRQEITFMGCVDNQDAVIGRGRLYKAAERTFLRLERTGDRVDALCSADGEQWYTVGQVTFPVDDPIQIGVHAIGKIDRTVYHGAYPEGTAIRFESFRLWKASG